MRIIGRRSGSDCGDGDFGKICEGLSRIPLGGGGGLVDSEEGRSVLKEVFASTFIIHIRRNWDSLLPDLEKDSIRISLAEPLTQTWERRLPFYDSLSHVEYFAFENEDPDRSRLLHLVRYAMRWTEVPVFRLGTGTSFLSLTLSDYTHWFPSPSLCGYDAVEFRADLLKAPHNHFHFASQLAFLRQKIRSPIIFTLRSKAQGGKWEGNKSDYYEILRSAARWGCEYVDVEADWGHPPHPSFFPSFTQLIVSDHRMSEEEEAVTLSKVARMAIQCRDVFPNSPAILKVVHRARSVRDCGIIQQFLQETQPGGAFSSIAHPLSPGIISVLVGEYGRLSRVLCPILTPCTHESLQVPAAPGQLSLSHFHNLRESLHLDTREGSWLRLFGSPISRSPSPSLHNAALRSIGCPPHCLSYGLFETESIHEAMAEMEKTSFVGGNVTIPLKEEVFRTIDPKRLSHSARSIGAVNTVWKKNGKIYGDNTDWIALFELCRTSLSSLSSPIHVVIVGAGGTARAAVYASLRLGAEMISVVNRTYERALEISNVFGSKVTPYSEMSEVPQVPHIIFSCVPSSAQISLPDEWIESSVLTCAVEVAYLPRNTPFLKQIRQKRKDIRIVEGWEILLEQGIWGWKIWCGRQDVPIDVMKESVLCHLAAAE